jgi:hypothetical protein
MNVSGKLVNYYVFIIICIVPLFYLPFSEADVFRQPKFALWTASFLITVLFLLRERIRTKEEIHWIFSSRINLMLGIYMALWTISTLLSVDKMSSITGLPLYNGLFQLILSIGTFLLVAGLFEFRLAYLKYVAITYIIISIYSILQYFRLDPLTPFYSDLMKNYEGQVFATIGNQNQVATCFIVAFVILSFYFIMEEQKRSDKLLTFISSILIFAGIMAASSRGGLLSISIVYLVSLPFVLKNKNYVKRYFTLALTCSLIFIIMDYASGSYLMDRMSTIYSEAGMIAQGEVNPDLGSKRMEIWINSIPLIKEYWLFGSGPATFFQVYDTFGFNQNGVQIASPHNESLLILITTGIFSLITYWAIVIVILVKGIRKIKENSQIVPLLLGLITYLIKNMLNCTVVTDMIIFWVLLAVIFGFTEKKTVSNR